MLPAGRGNSLRQSTKILPRAEVTPCLGRTRYCPMTLRQHKKSRRKKNGPGDIVEVTKFIWNDIILGRAERSPSVLVHLGVKSDPSNNFTSPPAGKHRPLRTLVAIRRQEKSRTPGRDCRRSPIEAPRFLILCPGRMVREFPSVREWSSLPRNANKQARKR